MPIANPPYKIIPGLYIADPRKQYTQYLFAKLASSAREIREIEFRELVKLAKNPELTILAEQTGDFYLARLIQLADSKNPYILAQLSDLARSSEIMDLAMRANNAVLDSLIKCATDHKANYEENIKKIAILRSGNDFNPETVTDESMGYIPESRYYPLPDRSNNDDLTKEKYLGKISYSEVIAFIEQARLKGLTVIIQSEWFNDEAAALVTAYLMKTQGYDKEISVNHIRKITGLSCDFSDEQNKALSFYEKPKIVAPPKQAIIQQSRTTPSLFGIFQKKVQLQVNDAEQLLNNLFVRPSDEIPYATPVKIYAKYYYSAKELKDTIDKVKRLMLRKKDHRAVFFMGETNLLDEVLSGTYMSPFSNKERELKRWIWMAEDELWKDRKLNYFPVRPVVRNKWRF